MITFTCDNDRTVTLAAPPLGISVTTEDYTPEVTIRRFAEGMADCMLYTLLPDVRKVQQALAEGDHAKVLELFSLAENTDMTSMFFLNEEEMFIIPSQRQEIRPVLREAVSSAQQGKIVTHITLKWYSQVKTFDFSRTEAGVSLEVTVYLPTLRYEHYILADTDTLHREDVIASLCANLPDYIDHLRTPQTQNTGA